MRARALLLLLTLAGVSAAEEKILEFDSQIDINGDGSLEVVERIVVQAEGYRIRRGIYRDFPTNYVDAYGNRAVVRYKPLSATRNGAPENFFSEDYRDGVRTYFGESDRLLTPGVHEYEYRYRVNRVLGMFAEHDELYWNVTGNGWVFAIERATATIRLGFEGEPLVTSAEAFTGLFGSVGTDYVADFNGATASFATTASLVPHAGLTVVVTWPKGFVTAPSRLKELWWWLVDNVNVLIVFAGAIAVFVYLFRLWLRHGKDPEPGLIVTRYEPPSGISPAALRYILQMRYDDKVMTAAIVNLAAKGYLEISEWNDAYTLKKIDPAPSAPPLETGEADLYRALFSDFSELTLGGGFDDRALRARSAHRRALERECDDQYIVGNANLGLPVLLIAIPAAVAGVKLGSGPNLLVVAGIVLMVVFYVFFHRIMDRPTAKGRQLLDEVMGFRDYLDIAERDELELRNPPEKTPALFERLLPYALALGVEQRWAEQFAAVFAGLQKPDGGGYSPSWFRGDWEIGSMANATSAMSRNLSSSIRSSATRPGSTSGSSSFSGSSGGGGGFSGGGGGGGGGGGW